MPSQALFSVVVPTWNRSSYLAACLPRLRQQNVDCEYEVIVVDNGSQDDTVQTFLEQSALPGGHRLKYFALREPGSSMARNQGAKVAQGEWLAFTDDDCLPPLKWLAVAKQKILSGRKDPFGGPALAVLGTGSANWFPPELEDLQMVSECNFFITKEDFFMRGGFPCEGGPRGGQWRTHEGNRLYLNGSGGNDPSAKAEMYPELFIFHHLEGRRCRLKFRLYKKFMGGWAHGREKTQKRLVRPAIRLTWSLLFAPIFIISAGWRPRAKWPDARYFFADKGGVKLYRIGELAGEMLGDGWGFLKKFKNLSRPHFARWLSPVWGRPTPKVLVPEDIPQGAKEVREATRSSQPRSIGIIGSPNPWMNHQFLQHPAQWCLNRRRVLVYGPTLGVMTPEEGLISSVSIEWGRHPEKHFTQRRIFLPRATPVSGKTLILASTGGNTFFHWMMDVLPRMEIAQMAGWGPEQHDWFLVNSLHQKFQVESLEQLGIPRERCLEIDDRLALELEWATLPSLPGISGVPRKSSIQFLKKLFLEQETTPRARRLLFIGRETCHHRRLADAGKLWRHLQALGFEKFDGTGLSIREQANIFRSAQMIVAVHGAALTNLVFCEPGTKLLELFSWDYVNPCYRDLCHLAGIKHQAALIGENPHPHWSHQRPSTNLTPSEREREHLVAWISHNLT